MSVHNSYFYEVDGVLHFHLDRPANTTPAVPFVFDGLATERHKKDYASDYQAFLATKGEVDKVIEEETKPEFLFDIKEPAFQIHPSAAPEEKFNEPKSE